MVRFLNRPHFLADQGIEAALVATEGDVRPCAAAFTLFDEPHGEEWLRAHYRRQAEAAGKHGLGFQFETPTWRASSDWGDALGYGEDALSSMNKRAVALCREMADAHPDVPSRVVAQIGPRNCSYVPSERMSADEAAIYHRAQIRAFAQARVDSVAALGINDIDEAVGILIAARCSKLPCSVSFSVDSTGRLPSGLPLARAIVEVDEMTGGSAEYFGVICSKPLPVLSALPAYAAERVHSVRASHAPFGDDGYALQTPRDSNALARDLAAAGFVSPFIEVCGGACGCRPVPQRWPKRLPAALTDCLNEAPVLH